MHQEESDYRIREQVGFLLRQAHQRAAWIFSERIGSQSLTPPQFNALALINELGPQSQAELAANSAMDTATTQGVVTRLADRGLITRTRDQQDRRRWILQLTEAGQQLLNAGQKIAKGVSTDILLPLKPKEREIFLKLLKRIT